MKKIKSYTRPNPVVSGQTTPKKKELLRLISETHNRTESKLVDEALDLAIPKLLKRYPVPTSEAA